MKRGTSTMNAVSQGCEERIRKNANYKKDTRGFTHGIFLFHYDTLLEPRITQNNIQEIYVAENIGTSASQQQSRIEVNVGM